MPHRSTRCLRLAIAPGRLDSFRRCSLRIRRAASTSAPRPWSQHPAWRREALSALLGDAYHHVAALDNPNAHNGGPLALANAARDVALVQQVLVQQPALLRCGCPDWRTCQRSLAVATIQAATPGLRVAHLDPPSPALASGEVLALTLWEPWASLLAIEALFPGQDKHSETRSWPTRYRGWLAIHAAQGGLSKRDLAARCAQEPFRATLARRGAHEPRAWAGRALGHLAACLPTEEVAPDPAPGDPNWHFGDYTPGRWGWMFDRLIALPVPVPATGRQKLWPWAAPPEIWSLLADAGVSAPPAPHADQPGPSTPQQLRLF